MAFRTFEENVPVSGTETGPQEEVKVTSGIKRFLLLLPSWKKIGSVFLFLFLTLFSAGLGYTAVWAWQRYIAPLERAESKYADWQVYRNEKYKLGLRYPKDWDAKEVDVDFAVFTPSGENKVANDYISLLIKATGSRSKTECEEDSLRCSFFVNGIYGEKIVTPEAETVFFSSLGADFTLTLSKSGTAGADFSKTFKEISESLRFIDKDGSR